MRMYRYSDVAFIRRPLTHAHGACATIAHVLTKGVWFASWDTQTHESLDEAAVVATSFNMQCVCISISAGSLSATFELASLSEL
jgi:hypothetical protein